MPQELGNGPRLASLKASLRRGVPLAILIVLAGAVLGGFYGAQQSQTHTAGATVLIDPLVGNPFNPEGRGDDLVNLETEAHLLRSDAVARLVAQDIEYDGAPADLLKGLKVTVPPNTQILDLTYEAPRADEAVVRAQSFADVYLAYRQSRADALVATQTARIDDQITSRNEELRVLTRQLSRTPAGTANSRLLTEKVEAVSTQINQLRARSAELATGSLDAGQVVTPASVPGTGPFSPTVLMAVVGAMAGLVVAVVIALVRARADNRIHHVDEVEALDLEVLGSLDAENLAAVADRLEHPAQGVAAVTGELRRIRVALLTGDRERPFVLAIAAASDSEGSAASALAIGMSIAASNVSTVVVDATGQPNGPSTILPDATVGMNDVLWGSASVDDALARVAPHLDVVPRGDDAMEVDDLFVAPQMQAFVDELRGRFEVVILAGSTLTDPRTRALVALADEVVIEVVEATTTHRDLTTIPDVVPQATSRLVGCVYLRPTKTTRRRRTLRRSSPTGPADPSNGAAADTDGEDTAGPAERDTPVARTEPSSPQSRYRIVLRGGARRVPVSGFGEGV